MILVAKTLGMKVQEVIEQPFALTLWTWMEIQEARRIESLIDDNRSLRDAGRLAMAFHEPNKLREEQAEWEVRAGIALSADDLRERAEKLASIVAKNNI